MDGVSSLGLDELEYTLTPVNTGMSGLIEMAKSASTNAEGGAELHVLDVVDPDGTGVLEVKRGGQTTTEKTGLLQSDSVDRWYAFETPDSERLLILEYEEHGWTPGDEYTLRDVSTDSVLATWERTSMLKQTWAIDSPSGETAAIASKPWQRTLRELVPFSRSKTFTVTAPGDSEVARIQIIKSGRTSLKGREVEVTLKESGVPSEILLAFAVSLRREVAESASHGHDGDGADGE